MMPNIGFDLLGVLACKVMPPLLAGRALLYITLLGGGYGFGVVTHKLGAHPAVALLTPTFQISTPLFLGFNNYILGLAILPYVLLSKMQNGLGYFVLYVILVLACFLSHGEAAFLGLLLAVGWESQRSGFFSKTTLLALVVPLICIAVLVKLSPTTGELSVIRWGDLHSKLLLVVNGLKTNSRITDILWATSLACFGFWLIKSKSSRFSRKHARLGLGLALVAILMPEGFQVAAGLDFRIVPIAAIFLCICLQVAEPHPNWKLLVAVLIFSRTCAFYFQLARGNETGKAVHSAIMNLPKDALLFNVMWDPKSRHRMDRWNPAPLNLVHFGCVDEFRFVSGLYTHKTQQPLLYSTSVARLNWIGIEEDEPQAGFLASISSIRSILSGFPNLSAHPVYVFLSNTDGAGPVAPEDAVRIAKGAKFQIFRLR